MTHLILHKVRGEPAFDIAERCDDMGTESDPGPWWIIPTSGHRAYPYKSWAVKDLACANIAEQMRSNPDIEWITDFNHGLPPEWPDHYQIRRDAPKTMIGLGEVMSMIMPKLKRRI